MFHAWQPQSLNHWQVQNIHYIQDSKVILWINLNILTALSTCWNIHSFGLITNQTFQSRRVKPLQYKWGCRTYSQVPIFICQLHNLCLKSFALLHKLPCFSVIKWNTMWFWHRSILLRCVQYWGGFACIYIILQTSRIIWEFTYLEKNHPQHKSETMRLLIEFNEVYIYSKLNRHTDNCQCNSH